MKEDNTMERKSADTVFSAMTHEEKNHVLFLKQKEILDTFLEHGAISKADHDKSLHDLTKKMGDADNTP